MCETHSAAGSELKAGEVDIEFDHLSEKDGARRPYGPVFHCHEHRHFVVEPIWCRPTYRQLLWAGLLGIALTFLGSGVGATLLALAGIAIFSLTVAGALARLLRRDAVLSQLAARSSFAFPAVSTHVVISATERVRTTIRGAPDGTFETRTSAPEGSIATTLTLDPRALDLLAAHRTHLKAANTDVTSAHGGFLSVSGLSPFRLECGDGGASTDVRALAILPLVAPIEEVAALSQSDQTVSSPSTWVTRHRYGVAPVLDSPPDHPEPDFGMYPTVVTEGDHHSLRLVLTFGQLDVESIDTLSLRLGFPTSPRDFVTIEPPAIIASPRRPGDDNYVQLVEWKNPPIRRAEHEIGFKTFYLSLEESLPPLTSISGTVSMTLSGSLAGLEHVVCFDPFGQPRESVPTIRSHYTLDFDLPIDHLLFQRTTRRRSHASSSRFPTFENVAALLHDLAEGGVYVRHVIQSPSLPHQHRPDILLHYWDVLGRYYEGLEPMEIHLVVKGEAPKDPDVMSELDNTTVLELAIRGSFAGHRDDPVDAVYERMTSLMSQTFSDAVWSTAPVLAG